MSKRRATPGPAAPAFHGYAPERPGDQAGFRPPLSITLSRQAGARGQAVGQRVAERLGWQFLHQETLEYLIQSPHTPTHDPAPLAPEARVWVEATWEELRGAGLLPEGTPTFDETPVAVEESAPPNAEYHALVARVLGLAAHGGYVLLVHGAAGLIPSGARLSVRLVAPAEERVAFEAEQHRLSRTDAERLLRERDAVAEEYLERHLGRARSEVETYDLVLDVGQLGVEGCTTVILAALEAKQAFLQPPVKTR